MKKVIKQKMKNERDKKQLKYNFKTYIILLVIILFIHFNIKFRNFNF